MVDAVQRNFAVKAWDFGQSLVDPLLVYHNEFKHNFTLLPPHGKVWEVAKRVWKVAAGPFYYSALGLQATIGKLLHIGLLAANWLSNGAIGLYPAGQAQKTARQLQIDQESAQLQAQLNQIKVANMPAWREQSAKLLHKSRYSNPQDELYRLKTMGILTPGLEARLDHSIGQVALGGFNYNLANTRLHVKVLIGQALELKALYKDTHRVFIHAQATKWAPLTYMIKEAIRQCDPNAQLNNFKPLRTPDSMQADDFLTSMFKYLSSWVNYFWGTEEKEPDVRDYLKAHSHINDTDMQTRSDLLSVDAYYLNYTAWESSLYFLVNNKNDMNPAHIKEFSKKLIQKVSPKHSSEQVNALANQVAQIIYNNPPCSNLYVVCVPKAESAKMQYRAHAYGPPCKCHPPNEADTILNRLQNEQFDSTLKCNTQFPVPQYRLYMPAVKRETGARIYMLTPFSKQARQQVKTPIRNLMASLSTV